MKRYHIFLYSTDHSGKEGILSITFDVDGGSFDEKWLTEMVVNKEGSGALFFSTEATRDASVEFQSFKDSKDAEFAFLTKVDKARSISELLS